MEPLKIVVADNEPLALQQLEKYLSSFDDIEIVESCKNGKEALEAIKKHHPDVVFLDIEMPELTGIEIMETLDESESPFVVFVTAYDEYAVKAFEVNALDYLLKPFNKERITETLVRATKYIHNSEREKSQKSSDADSFLSRILIKTSKKMFFLDVKEINHIEASGNYAKIVTADNKYLIRTTLKHLDERLSPKNFARIHKSTIININRVKELEQWFTGDFEILLESGKKVKMSRNYKNVLERFR